MTFEKKNEKKKEMFDANWLCAGFDPRPKLGFTNRSLEGGGLPEDLRRQDLKWRGMEEGVETHQIAVGEAEVPIKVTSQANTPAEEIRSCRVQGESILDALPFSITRQKLGDFSKICEKSKLIVIMLLKTPIKEFPTGCYAPSL